MFKEYLLSNKKNGTPVSLYSDREHTEKFSFGFIQGISNDHVLLACISPLGLYDGFMIVNYKGIYQCEIQDQYSEKLLKLYHLRKQKHPVLDIKSDNLILDLIQYAQENRLIISAGLHDSGNDDLQGYVTTVEDGLVTIEQLSDDGSPDGESVVSFEDITYIVCDSDNEIALKLLAENP